MCFDKDVSLNTFIIGMFALFMVKLNENTSYCIDWYKGEIYTYIFLISVISMQLIEYILWSNLDNKKLNRILSLLALLLIISQPLFSLLAGSASKTIIMLYLSLFILFLLYKNAYNPINLHTDVNDTHLRWNWLTFNGYENILLIVWLLALFYGIYLRDMKVHNRIDVFTHGVVMLILIFSVYMYFKKNTWGSLWCFWINIISFYLLVSILIIKPFMRYNNISCIK
jgi:hypothetical protein